MSKTPEQWAAEVTEAFRDSTPGIYFPDYARACLKETARAAFVLAQDQAYKRGLADSIPLHNRIVDAEHKHEVRTGCKPTKLYLGRAEWAAATDFDNSNRTVKPNCGSDDRSTYRGLAIYVVAEENYLEVGL